MTTEIDYLQHTPRSTAHPDFHDCPRGCESGCEGRAIWHVDDSCSWCGSLHPDIFMARCEAGDVKLGPTDKSYKVYVHNRGGESFRQTFRSDKPKYDENTGGQVFDPSKWVWETREMQETKFYFQHLSEDQKRRFIELLNAKTLHIDYPGYFYRAPFFCVVQDKAESGKEAQ